MIIITILTFLSLILLFLWLFLYNKISLKTTKYLLFLFLLFTSIIWLYFTYNYWNTLENYIIYFWNLIFLMLIIILLLTLIELNENYKITDEISNKEKTDINDIENIEQIKDKNFILLTRFFNLLLLLLITIVYLK